MSDPTSSAEPTSWLVIEHGWKVYAVDGSEVGSVDEVVGDRGLDIFDGLAIKTSRLAAARYVPAEQVRGIVEGRIQLALTASEAERLPRHERPPRQEEILPETSSFTERVSDALRRMFRGPRGR